MDPTANKHGLDELDDDISFFKNISSQVVSTPHVNSSSMRKFEHTPLNGLTLSMLLSPSIHHNVTYSNLNTEEKKIFLPSEHAKSVNITKGDSSDLFDKSSDCKQSSVLKKFNSPLLFDTEQNTSVPIRRPVTGSSTKNENSVVKMIHSNGSLETNLNENKANEVKSTDKDVMATEFSKVLEYSGSNCKLKESTMNHKSKTNPCKVLFEADNSRDCFLQKEDLVDSPITITNVTPLYEKLKSSLNNSKKSNNETKIDNLVVNYLEEVIEFKSEDKTAPKSERTPTRNKPVSLQVIPRSLNFVNEKSKHLSDRSKSPSLDDFFHVEKVDGDVFDILEATNSEDNDDIIQSSQRKEKKSDKVKFIYPSDLLKVKKRNLNHEVGKLNFNKDLIFELEAMKEMSDVKEFSTENHKKKTISSWDTTSTNRLMSFSEVLMNSQESCVLNKLEKRMMSENTQFPITQIDTIFKNLELDRPVVSTKRSKPVTTLFSASPEVQKISKVPMNTVYEETKSDFHVTHLDPFFGFSENERLHLLYKKEELMLILSNMSNHSKQEKFEKFQNNLNVSEVETETNDEFNNTKIVTINSKENNEVTSSVSLISQSISKKPEFSSFKCASGKNININPNTLLKSKLLFASIDEELKGDTEMFSNWIPNRISDKKSNIESFSNTLRNTNTSEVCNIKVPFEKIGKSSIVNLIHTEPAILKNRCNTNGTQTCVKSSCLEFEDSFVIPQTQDMEQESRNKYEKEHNSREKPDEVNINDISNSQFHQLGELVDKQHKLSIKKELTYDQKNLLLQTNCNCPNETMKSVRPKSPDFSCSVQTASQNLIRQENALSSLLPRSMKQVGNKAASVSKLTWSKMSQRNSFDFLKLNKLSETIDKAVKSGSLPMDLKNNKKSSIPQVGKSPSPDLSSNFGNMIEKRNKYCTLESLLCFDDNTLGPNNKLSTVSTNLRDIGKHASQLERVVDPLPAKDFQGFSCDALVMAIRKFQFTTFHQIIDEFKGFSDQGITSKVKKQFILKHLLDSGSRTDHEHKVDHFQTLHEHQTNYFEVKTKENTGVFSSSSDEKTTVTAESLNKAKLHLDITDKNHFNLQIKEISTSSVLCKPAVGGLLCESGKKITICEASLKKAKQLLEIVDENHTNDFKARSKSATGDFASPSVKKTTVAVDSLKKAKQVLDTVDESITTNEKTKSAIGGFVSASGKKIILSEESLKKAKQLLDDVDENITIDKKVEHKSAMGDFASASRKKITVSEESLNKAKQLLDDVDENITIDVKEEPKSAIRGFASASGKKITVSEESLKKAKQLLDDVDENITIDKKVETKSAMGGFASASGKKITVSEDSLKKAKQLLDDVDENITIDKKVETKSAMGGFASASGKKITVSEDSLKKAKQLLDDVDENITIDKKRETKSAIRGFASASGKKITVSEDSLKKAKQLLDDVDENITIDVKEEPKSAIRGFASASGKKITVSEESLKKAKQLLDDVDENITIDKKVETKSATGDFASASGKKITVSEESLKKAKQLLDDVHENITIDVKVELESAIRGFASASGKKITVSEDSLKKAKQLLDDVDENISIDKKVEAKSAMGGFASASGKKITVSEESLKKAKQLLDNVNENITIDKKVETKSAIGGFASASGKKITVSEDSLKNAKQLLDNVDESITTNEKVETKSAIGGFASANGKKITVSKDNLKKAKQLLIAVDKSITTNEKVETKSAIGGFASASGKKIAASKDSLNKGKVLLDTADEDFKTKGKLETKSAIGGFASASPKKMTVSEECVKKEKLYLDTADHNLAAEGTVETKPAIAGFASESGKKRAVPEENLERSNQLLHRIEDSNNSQGLDKPILQSKSAVKDFVLPSREKKAKILLDKYAENNINTSVSQSMGIPRDMEGKRKLSSESPDLSSKFVSRLENVSMNFMTELLAGETKSPESSFENMRKLNVPLGSTNKRRKLCFTQPGGKDLPDCKLINGTANANVVSEKEKVFRAKVIAKREIALVNQRKHIAECCRLNKKGQYHVTFQTGSFYRAKQMKEERISFTEMTKRKAPGLFTSAECIMSGIPETVLSMTLEQAGNFQFNLLESYDTNFLAVNTDGIVAGDNVRIIINQHDQVGLAQVQAGFLTSPHVNCCVVSDRWVENHYALLVWKFCSLERSYPDMFKGKICTLDNLLLQLKYRYDCEMENQISCLKKMIQCDDTPNKRIILVVSRVLRNIARVGNTSLNKSHPLEDIQLEMSDGWYCIRVQVDEEMKALVARQRVKVGTKLITCNAEMYNNDQGCDPLHIKPDIYLKLHTNCTRRAHWLSKLGYTAVPEALAISLSSILARGGLVPQIKMVLARVYPMLYMERNTGGKAIIRSEKMENLAMMKFQKYYEKQLELIYTRLRSQSKTEEMKEAKKKPSVAKMSKAEIRAITSGEDLYNLVSTNFDSILNLLTNEQLSELEKYKMTVREQIATNVQQDLKQEVAGRSDLNRQVTSLLKMKICDVSNPDSTAMLTIWRPDPSILELLREGKCFRLQYVTSSGFRFGEIQLSTTKHTQFIPYSSDTDDASISRHVSLIDSPLVPRFGEVDAVGLVVHIAEVGNKTVVFLANEKSQFLAVDFWNGLKESGYEDILRVGSVVGCSNLQYRANAIAGLSFISDPSACNASSTENTMDLTQYIPSTCSTEHSVYTRNPRAKHLNSAHAELAACLKEMNLPAYITKCQSLIQTNPTQSRYTPSHSKLLNHSNLSNPSGLSRKRPSLLESGSSAKKLCTEANQSLSNSTTGGPDNHYTSINASSTSCNSLHPEKHESPSTLSSSNDTDHTLSSSNVTATDINESSNAQPVNSSVVSSTTETCKSISSTSINRSSSSNNLILHKQHIRGKSSDNLMHDASPSLSTPKRLPLGNQSCPVNTSTPNPPGAHSHLAGKTSTPIGPSPFGAQFQSSFEDEGVVTPIQRKIRTLERYREPPPLTPGILSLRSKKLLKPFRVPRK